MKRYNKLSGFWTVLAGVMLTLGASGSVGAGCLEDPSASGSILVDATTSCEAISQAGCRVDNFQPGTNSCTIPGSSTTVTVTQAIPGDKSSGVKWTSSAGSIETVNWVLIGGATQGGACGTIWDPGTLHPVGDAQSEFVYGFLKSNGNIQSVTYVDFCSKLETPQADLGLTKRVVAEDTTDNTYNCNQAVKSLDLVLAGGSLNVKYCYTIRNDGGAAYPVGNITLTDDMGTPGVFDDDLLLTNDTELPPGQSIQLESGVVAIANPATIVNTANIIGEDENQQVAEDLDQATITAVLSPVDCTIVEVKDSEGNDLTNKYLKGYLLNPNSPSDIALCVNEKPSGSYPSARRNRCIDQCIIKEDCKKTVGTDTGVPEGCEQRCEPSGYWTDTNADGTCKAGRPANVPPNAYPYCWEIQQDLDFDCTLNPTAPIISHENTVEQVSVNPFVYKDCWKQGGRKVCETTCYLYSGEDATACPATADVIVPAQ